MANKKSANFLPDYLRTDKNKKFLSRTLDQLIQTPDVERIDGYVGSKLTPNFNPNTDFYLSDTNYYRKNYALEPSLVIKNSLGNINDVISFDDLLNELDFYNSDTNNLDKLFKPKFYSYDPYIDWDKLVNYINYYWMPQGPETILIDELGLDVDSEIVGSTSYDLPYQYLDSTGSNVSYKLTNGLKITFGNSVTPFTYRGNTYYVEGVGNSIVLIDIKLLENNNGITDVYDETFDSDGFDQYPFDGEKSLPLVTEYITINRASKDLNPWTRYNRWFHKEVIRISSEINNILAVYEYQNRAKRPIVEFKANLKLFNFGTIGLQNVDLIDNDTEDLFSTVNGSYGYYIDSISLKSGYRVIFNADSDNKNKIFSVSYTTGTTSTIVLTTVTVLTTASAAVSINFGLERGGTSWYFDITSQSWKQGQQHSYINQPPLFDVFDNQTISYTNTSTYKTNFAGTKIFGYDVGTGTSDTVLGFPLKYQNSSGIGSFLFKNYFMTDEINFTENNISTSLPVSNTYLLNYETDSVFNVWQDVQDYKIPIIEIQTLDLSTNQLNLNCLDIPIDVAGIDSIKVYKNEILLNSTFTATSTSTEIILNEYLNENDVVQIKVVTSQNPNAKGYYETPISLTNNPFNGPVVDFTLSELRDHLFTMLDDITDPIYDGTNLRDIVDYAKYGTRIVVNANPIAYALMFFGKKEHNVVDAIRTVGNHYSQFKSNFLRKLLAVSVDATPSQAVDSILKEINITKNYTSAYYRSDMLGYGDNKTILTYTVSNPAITDYPIGIDFSISSLSNKSVLVYLNGDQLIYGKDYTINIDEISIIAALSAEDEIVVKIYEDTLGCYVPPTPSKLGLYPKYEPEIFVDDTFRDSPINMIRGHDGSVVVAYNDYRDDIIIELEKRIFNNIKVAYRSDIFDVRAGVPGAFRDRSLFKPAIESLYLDFSYWAGINNVDVRSHPVYDEADPFTWNFKDSIDKILGETVPKFWRGIYNYFFDTDHPHTRPWEMLGYANKPAWWDTYYDWVDNVKRSALISAITLGKISNPADTDVFNSKYARSNFINFCPVDPAGALIDPLLLVTANDISYRNDTWDFGDGSPAEAAWRNSSYWPFAVNIISVLLNPTDYLSTMFDTSRLSLNVLDQITYTEDDLYLGIKKVILDGENNNLTSGYGVFVVEAGKLVDQDYIARLRSDIDYFEFNLFHKLGGFTNKEKLQINIDSVDPVSTSPGLVLPYEDYNIFLNISNPVKTASASGMIIQKSNGKFVIKGYDLERPYFDVLLPFKERFNPTLTVGGLSEDFTEWSGITQNKNLGLSSSDTTSAKSSPTTRFYKEGQIVRYANKFYRCKVGHNPSGKFDTTLWYSLPKLPTKGGVTVETSKKFAKQATRYYYGTEIASIQDMYNIVIGYGAFLESEGFQFIDYSTEYSEALNWKYSAKEFLYWCTQNWAEDNLITLSPFANSFKYSFPNSVVEDITNSSYKYSLLKADGKPFPIDKFSLIREDGYCQIDTKDTDEGIFFVKLISVQKEHGIVFNNTTVFNDTIYDIETGYKQRRIKLSGFRTKNWNGDFYSPGFIYDNVTVNDWETYKEYIVGSVVRYNGSYYQANKKLESKETFDFTNWSLISEKPVPDLLPNFEYKILQFEDFYSLDIDNFDVGQQKLAQHLIGYTPRTYFNNIFTNPISQYKFYQGFIKDKGTKNTLDKLSKASRFLNKGEVTFNEEWAFRSGVYGGYNNYDELEFTLSEGTSLENPYLISFVDTVPTDQSPLVNYVTPNDLLLSKQDYISSSVFDIIVPENLIVPESTSTNSAITPAGTYNETGFIVGTAGYVRLDDVTATAYNKNSLLDIAKNGQIQNNSTIWLGFLENGDWNVYRYVKSRAKITGVYVSAPGSSITFSCNLHHNLDVGDIVSVVNFNDQVNGVYIVTAVPQISQFTVDSTLSSIENQEQLAYGTLFNFRRARFTSLNNLINRRELFDLDQGQLIWIDSGIGNRWEVYEKYNDWPLDYIESTFRPEAQELGHTIWAGDNTSKFFVSAPNYHTTATYSYGRVKVFDREDNSINKLFEYTLNSVDIAYCNPSKPTEFGYAMAYDVNKNYIIVGAPKASNVKGISSIEAVPANVTFAFNILASNSATVVVASGASVSINGFIVSPDEVTYNMSIGVTTSTIFSTAGTFTSSARVFDDEGIVKISSIGPYNDAEIVEAVLTNPLSYYSTASNKARFGHSIYINEASTSNGTLLIVSAPGTPNVGDDFYVYPTSVSYVGSTGTSTLSISSTTTVITTGTIGNVFAYRLTKNNGIQVSSFASGLGIYSTSTVDLKIGDQWGYKVSGNSTGTYVAISAPNYNDTNSSGVVQVYRYGQGFFHNQTLFSPYGATGNFGKEHLISHTGKYLIISAPDYRNNDTSFGSVTVYRLGNTRQYSRLQTINNPKSSSDLKFGYSLSLNKNEDKLLISGLGTNRSTVLRFDVDSKTGETVFDQRTTKFIETIPDSGTVYAYQRLGEFFVPGNEVIDSAIMVGSKYGYDVFSTNEYSYVGAPFTKTVTGEDNSMAFIYDMPYVFSVKHRQPDVVDVSAIERVALIDSLKEEVVEYLELIDPVKGKISGLAEQEIKYKSPSDPAIYSIGTPGKIVDDENNWLDEHVGELWWDLSTIKYVWYEQGDDIFRKNNWGKVFPGATIDIYEWVRSDLLPSAWAAQADTNNGTTLGISGQPKHPNNDTISVKQIYNSVTGNFENVYYFWVKNKLLVPNVKNRRISAYQVASLIADPQANGIKYAEILSPSSIALANVQPLLIDDRISVNFSFTYQNVVPRHTEWMLLREGIANSVPNYILEKKLFDSLIGEDINGNKVPDPSLTYRNKYGLGIRPQQTLFKDRVEALRNIVIFVNDVLSKENIVGKYDLTTLLEKDEIPSITDGKYDVIVDSVNDLDTFDVSYIVQATLSCIISNGKIVSVSIVDQGNGYLVAPTVVIENDKSSAEISLQIDSLGRVISATINNAGYGFTSVPVLTVRRFTAIVSSNVDDNGRWTKHEFNTANGTWTKIYTQRYRTEDYWDYIDWSANSFDQFKILNYVVETSVDLTLYTNVADSTYIKVKNNGRGNFVIVEKVSSGGDYTEYFNLIYVESGTIKILDKVWSETAAKQNFDNAGLADTVYDQSASKELRNILLSIKNELFVGDLKVNWNLLFFAAVRYALTEQKLLDWAFKTSFINVTTDLGTLDQRAVYKLDNEKYFEDYIKEIKPYHTQIRSYTSKYNSLETYQGNITDFDLQPYYDSTSSLYKPITLLASTSATTFTITNTLTNVHPWKYWTNNYTYYVSEILVADGGIGYTQRPIITFVSQDGDWGSGATAEAFIRAGKIYKVIITNSGSGYIRTPAIEITGGGGVTQHATLSAIMANDTVRKNKIGIKFDRISKDVQIQDVEVYDKFICDGETNVFVLTWLAAADKSTIVPTLDGKLIFATDYKLEFFKQDYLGFYTKEFTKITLLNVVPLSGQELKVIYRKNIKLLSAVDRIEQYYSPTGFMLAKDVTNLVSGLDYPLTTYEGMKFEDTPPWGTTAYDTAPWDDIVSELVTVKLLEDVATTATSMIVSDVSAITTGQSIVIGNTSTIKIRSETIVTAINTISNTITFSSPVYNIKKVISTATSTGSNITVTTKEQFRGELKVGDTVVLSGIITAGYNGQYSVTTTTNKTFNITAQGYLNSTTTTLSTPATVRILSVLSTISARASVLDRVIQSSTGTSTLQIQTFALASQVSTATVDFGTGIGTWFSSTSSGTVQRLVIYVSGMTTTVATTVTVNVYGYTDVDFWKYNLDPDQLTVNLDGGAYVNGLKTSALGITATDNIVQGGGSIKPQVQYYGYRLNTTVPGTTASYYAELIDKFYLRYLYRHADQAGLDYWVSTIVDSNQTLEQVEDNIKISSEATAINATFNPDGLVNPYRSYAPEEYVPGDTKDSLSISVYTRPERISPIMFNGAIFNIPNQETTATLALMTDEVPAGLIVTFNGEKLTRESNYPMTSGNPNPPYFLEGNKLTVGFAPVKGRIGYSYITAGSDTGLDSQWIGVNSTSTQTGLLISDLPYNGVSSVYVDVDGTRIYAWTTSSGVGYVLQPVGNQNKRASVLVKDIPAGRHGITAWFFRNNFDTFNRISEIFYNISAPTTSITLTEVPYTLEPISAHVIVEKVILDPYSLKTRLLPPDVSYYSVSANLNTTYDINNKKTGSTYNNQNVKVYVNGYEIRPGFDFIVNSANETISIIQNIIMQGDIIAIMDLTNYDFVILDGVLRLKNSVSSGSIKITSFTDHDSMGIRSENFDITHNNEYYLSLPVINENYVWVTANNKVLIAGFDYYVKPDLQTVVLGNDVQLVFGSKITIMSINPSNYANNIVGYRIFKDIFDRHSYKRISRAWRTRLARELQSSHASVHVEDGSLLFSPNPNRNIPGVIFIDGERIEYFIKNGNELTQLRRGTYGTGVPFASAAGTLVYDQSIKQNIYTEENIKTQKIPTGYTTTYVISTLTNTSSFSINTNTHAGSGISLLTTSTFGYVPSYVDQVDVYFGGRKLRKTELKVHYNDRAYDTTSSVYYNNETTSSFEILVPEFTIQVSSSQTLVLNIDEEIIPGTEITVVQRTGKVWDVSTASILISTSTQAKFLRKGPTELPSEFYYGGNLELTDENNNPLLEDDGDLLQGL